MRWGLVGCMRAYGSSPFSVFSFLSAFFLEISYPLDRSRVWTKIIRGTSMIFGRFVLRCWKIICVSYVLTLQIFEKNYQLKSN